MNDIIKPAGIERSRIAVVLVSYKHSRYIRDALDGVRMQTREPDEVVIADDGSPDDTAAVIKSYVQEFSLENKWRLLLSPVNRGINVNLQHALDHTTADIIVPTAGDDISLPNRCALSERIFEENPNIDILSLDGLVIDENGTTLRELQRPKGLLNNIELAIRRGNPLISPVGQSWRRRLFDRFGKLPFDVPNEDDQITFWGFLSGGILCTPEQAIKYRVHGSSASAWLHTSQSDEQYLKRFFLDMRVRELHMRHWGRYITPSNIPDALRLAKLAEQKADFYAWMSKVADASWISRVSFFLRNTEIMTSRDAVYTLLGPHGVLLWRKLRKVLGRA